MRRLRGGMKMKAGLALLAVLCAQAVWAQPPASLTLRAKVRDFRDDPGAVNKHPDFHNEDFQACGGGANPGFLQNAISTADAANAQFAGDNRGPVLLHLNHPASDRPCYTSLERFRDWYDDVPGVNRSFYYDLVLTRNPNGTYTYNNDAFFPLDDGEAWRKFDPADDPDPFGMRTFTETHNYGFTLEIHTSFTYIAGQGQVFDFRGDDDTWVYINGRLAIDLGGLRSATAGTVNLDAQAAALGLVNGQSYPMDVFFAERYAYGSHFRISTTLLLGSQPPTLPMPVANPPGGVHPNSPVSVALSVPGHPADSVQIRYTLDGSDPDSGSLLYTGPLSVAIPIAGSTTLKAKAYRAGYAPSPIMTGIYSLQPIALPLPVADPPGRNFNPSIMVGLSVPGHPDAVIRYTVDGTDPTAQSPIFAGPLTFTQTTTLKARAYKPGWLPGGVMSETYPRDYNTLPKPVATPPGQDFIPSITVGLSVPGHPDAVIRYTVDGTEPTPQSPRYADSLVFTDTTMLKARAFETEWLPSEVMTEVYNYKVLPNVINIGFKRPLTGKIDVTSPVYPPDILARPFGAITGDSTHPNPVCVTCRPGTGNAFLQPAPHAEWSVRSKSPFRFSWHIFDNLGHFVVKDEGEITPEMFALAPTDAEGYKTIRFRWLHFSGDGRDVGTGVYILKGHVQSRRIDNDPGQGDAEYSIVRRFGYQRR